MVTVMRAMATGMGLALMLALPAAGQAVPHARVAQGELAGTIDHGAQAFLNIPFGAAPVGDRRWAAPLPPPAWSGVRDAGKFGPACMQQDARPQAPWSIEYFVLPPYSEDCLNLNVWTTGGSGKAVVLFIPGGGFTQGGGAVPVYNGSGMAKAGVVAVTMNYRLSAAGFLTHPELDAAAGHSGDYALMDVIAALTWIRQNIAAFGGDPAKVTVMGQSAGAAAIVALLHSPLASGLFRAAIIDSGVRAGRGAPTSAEREAVTKEWAASKGAATLAQMRALPASDLVPVRGASFRFGPTVDGHVVPSMDGPVVNDVPILTGWNGGEGAASSQQLLDAPVSRADFEARMRAQYGADTDALLAAYPSGADASAAAHAAGHDATMMGGAAWAAGHGRAPLYYYDFTHVMPGDTAAGWGSYHSSELPYVFGSLFTLDRPWTDADRQVSRLLMGYWVNFINSGDPNGSGLPRWTVFDAAKGDVMDLNQAPRMRAIANDDQRAFFTRWHAGH
jgi:para-nitrobenzyl esterase